LFKKQGSSWSASGRRPPGRRPRTLDYIVASQRRGGEEAEGVRTVRMVKVKAASERGACRHQGATKNLRRRLLAISETASRRASSRRDRRWVETVGGSSAGATREQCECRMTNVRHATRTKHEVLARAGSCRGHALGANVVRRRLGADASVGRELDDLCRVERFTRVDQWTASRHGSPTLETAASPADGRVGCLAVDRAGPGMKCWRRWPRRAGRAALPGRAVPRGEPGHPADDYLLYPTTGLRRQLKPCDCATASDGSGTSRRDLAR